MKEVGKWAQEKGLQSWELAGLERFKGWADGKQVTEAEFDVALVQFRNRQMGGGSDR